MKDSRLERKERLEQTGETEDTGYTSRIDSPSNRKDSVCTVWQTDKSRQKDRHTDRDTERHAEKDTERHTETHTVLVRTSAFVKPSSLGFNQASWLLPSLGSPPVGTPGDLINSKSKSHKTMRFHGHSKRITGQ